MRDIDLYYTEKSLKSTRIFDKRERRDIMVESAIIVRGSMRGSLLVQIDFLSEVSRMGFRNCNWNLCPRKRGTNSKSGLIPDRIRNNSGNVCLMVFKETQLTSSLNLTRRHLRVGGLFLFLRLFYELDRSSLIDPETKM